MSGAAEVVNAVERAGVPALGTSFLPDPQQLEMLRSADGTLSRGSIHIVRGRGRPKGALNKRSKKIADYYVQRYGDPLDALGQLANTPLRQLIEVLLEADGGYERAERLEALVEEAIDHIKSLRRLGADGKESAEQLSDAIEKLAKAAQAISGKPGKLALDALALQLQAHRTALEYVHGKQPIAIDMRKSADVVVVAPEILREHGIDAGELATAIATQGLEALDPASMRLIGAEDGEFSEVETGE